MPKLIMCVEYGRGRKSQEGEYSVTNLEEATKALREDLKRTAEPFWGARVMQEWNRHPGYCTMPDQEVTWHFVYKEN